MIKPPRNAGGWFGASDRSIPKLNYSVFLNLLTAFYLYCIGSSPTFAQSYYDVSTEYMLNYIGNVPMFGSGLSFYDFNKDGLDDITLCSTGYGAQTFVNTGNGFEQMPLFDALEGDVKQPIWLDFDNDGDADFFAARALEDLVLMRNDGNLNFTDVSDVFEVPNETYIIMGCSWGDYNNDSFLDLYVACYHQSLGITNWFFENNGDGSFTEKAVELGVDNGSKPTYQTLFVDYDTDGDMDLISVNDKHKGNFLYRNDDGVYTDISNSSGFNIPCDGMCATTADYDHDGDFDFYITNTQGGNQLLRNDNGTFTNIAGDSDVIINGWCWGSLWLDTNNDTSEDLFVTGGAEFPQENYYFESNETADDYELTAFCNSPAYGNATYGVAKGDINNDGFADIAVTHIAPVDYTLWMAEASENNWVKISAVGTFSNHDGIGAIAKLYIDDLTITKQWLCGENFLSQDSQHLIVGLGTHQSIDSVNVFWPSGWVDHYENMQVNLAYDFVEGETIAYLNSVSALNICPGDSVLLMVNTEDELLWENDEVSTQRWVHQAGEYTATITNEFGFQYTSFFEVDQWSLPEMNAVSSNPACAEIANGSVVITTDESQFVSFVWSDGGTGSFRNDLGLGTFVCEITTVQGCVIEEEFVLSAPPPIVVLNDLDKNICHGAVTSVEPEISGGEEPYEINWLGEDPNALGEGPHAFEVIDANGCLASFDLVVGWLPAIEVEVFADTVCHGATTSLQYVASGGSGELVFDFDEIDPESVGQGNYQVLVTDEQTCFVIHSFEVAAWETMQNNAVITHAQNGANGSIEINTSGGTAPYQYAWSNGSTDAAMDNLTQDEYSCVITDANGCTDEITIELVDLLVGTVFSSIEIFPQPFFESLTIAMPGEHNIRILNAAGQLIEQQRINGRMVLDTSAWSSGSYFLEIDQMQRKLLIRE
jgi:hypothetical protein